MNYFEELKKLLENSYSPYSKFKVSAIVITKDNNAFGGVNVENSSFGATICAERNAINSAISQGYKKGDFKELYIMVDSDKISFPCNICRQTLVELFDKDIKVICFNNNGDNNEVTVAELCPYPFDGGDLI